MDVKLPKAIEAVATDIDSIYCVGNRLNLGLLSEACTIPTIIDSDILRHPSRFQAVLEERKTRGTAQPALVRFSNVVVGTFDADQVHYVVQDVD
jgi:hypothetical protein